MRRSFLPSLAFLWLLASGCGGSAAVVEPPAPEPVAEPSGPAYMAATLEDGKADVRDLATAKVVCTMPAAGSVVERHAAPGGAGTSVVVAEADSVRLVVVHARAG